MRATISGLSNRRRAPARQSRHMSGLAVFLDATQLRPTHSLPEHEESQNWAHITASSVLPRLANDARAQKRPALGSGEGRGREGERDEVGH